MKTPKEMNLTTLIGSQQDGQSNQTQQSSESVVNYILKELKGCKTAWRTAFKSQAEVDLYKEQLLKACIENRINTIELVDKGLAESRRHDSDYFPSTGKFVQWCLGEKEHWEHKAQRIAFEESEKRAALPKPEIHKEVGKQHLEALKQSLTKRPSDV